MNRFRTFLYPLSPAVERSPFRKKTANAEAIRYTRGVLSAAITKPDRTVFHASTITRTRSALRLLRVVALCQQHLIFGLPSTFNHRCPHLRSSLQAREARESQTGKPVKVAASPAAPKVPTPAGIKRKRPPALSISNGQYRDHIPTILFLLSSIVDYSSTKRARKQNKMPNE